MERCNAEGWCAITGANTEAEGNGIAGASDLNGDGAADLVFGAWDPSTAQGEAWVAYGRP